MGRSAAKATTGQVHGQAKHRDWPMAHGSLRSVRGGLAKSGKLIFVEEVVGELLVKLRQKLPGSTGISIAQSRDSQQ